jgi:ribosomal protein S18 acetylase RimI-like enzyme
MQFSLATQSDQDAIFALHEKVFRPHIEQIWGWDDAWQKNHFQTSWQDVQTEIFRENGALMGYVQSYQEPEYYYVKNFAVEPQVQGQGIGSTVMELIKQRALHEGLPIMLSVFRTNLRAIKFYERLGFEQFEKVETGVRMQWKGGSIER